MVEMGETSTIAVHLPVLQKSKNGYASPMQLFSAVCKKGIKPNYPRFCGLHRYDNNGCGLRFKKSFSVRQHQCPTCGRDLIWTEIIMP